MTLVQRIRVTWVGLPGLPGVSTFYATDAATALPVLKNFYDAIGRWLPSALTITVEDTGESIEDTTGVATGVWAATGSGGSVRPTGLGAFSGASGAVVNWMTSQFLAGRRVRGRTFLVPLVTDAYDQGSITSGALTTLRDAANGLVTGSAGNLKVLSQPYTPLPGSTRPPRVGVALSITSASVPDLAAILRSRRD